MADDPLEIHDPVFGTLVFDGLFWIATNNVQFEFLAGLKVWQIAIAADAEDNPKPPTAVQQQLFTRVLGLKAEFRLALEQAIFTYCNRVLQQYRNAYDEPADHLAPVLTQPREVWALLSEPHVMVNYPDEHGICTLEILLGSAWDTEHGLSVAFCEDRIGISIRGFHFADKDQFDFLGNPI